MGARKTRTGRAARRPAIRGDAARPAGAPEPNARERILLAALQIFSEQGFDGARTRDIAERAGANLGLLAYYFEGKEQLWRAAVSRAFEDLRTELGGAIAAQNESDPEDDRARIARLLRHFVRFVARRPEFMRLMNDEGKRDGPRMRWLTDHHVRPLADAVRGLVERAQASGAIPSLPAASIHYVALGAAGLVFSQAPECARLTGTDPCSAAFAEEHADAVVQMLLGPEPSRSGSAR